ncbi:DUF2264 domain-containing protein [Mucisphaera sp.]|uniref:DUF2264 domain-containing protein n=1 Tax=Mucisphaera sp. TaxID=2913024 RepID=UPI003D141CB8
MQHPDSHTETGPAAYRQFLDFADRLVQPLIKLMAEGQSSLPIEGSPSNHGDDADRLEAFARPFLLLSLWLHGRSVLGISDESDQKVITWTQQAMALGSNPNSPAYWGTLTNYHQHAVEFAIFTMALDISRKSDWDTMDEPSRQQVLAFLAQIRGHGGHRNNHLFFDVLTLEFLIKEGAGELGDDRAITHHLDELECMHRGGGWFIDGGNESYDHYNAYAFHIYGLWWAHHFGKRDPKRARRWIDLAAQFLSDYLELYAASGEPVPIGRSLTYRFNGSGVFPLAACNGIDTVPLGVARRLCRQTIAYFLKHPIGQAQGCLSLGWTDHFETMADSYSCAASPYWAAKGLLMLTLDPEHPFFQAEEELRAVEKLASESSTPSDQQGDTTLVNTPGWVVRHRRGETMLINAGGSSSLSVGSRLGTWKWGKLVYHTGIGGLICAGPEGDPADAGLLARAITSDRCIGRQNTLPIEVTHDRIVCQYQLGDPYGDMNTTVRTHLWWREDWFIALHTGVAYQPTVLRAGAFALADPKQANASATNAIAATDRWATRIQNVSGFTKAAIQTPTQRQHLYASDHALPYLETDVVEGRFGLAYAWSLELKEQPCPFEVLDKDSRGIKIQVKGQQCVLRSSDWLSAN